MEPGKPINLTAGVRSTVTVNPSPSTNPVKGVILSNQSGYNLTVEANGSVYQLNPWTTDYYPIGTSITTIEVTPGASQINSVAIDPVVIPTLVWVQDGDPTGYPITSPQSVTLSGPIDIGSPVDVVIDGSGNTVQLEAGTQVGITGTVTVAGSLSIGNTVNVAISGSGNTVTLAAGSTVGITGTVNVNQVGTINATISGSVTIGTVTGNVNVQQGQTSLGSFTASPAPGVAVGTTLTYAANSHINGVMLQGAPLGGFAGRVQLKGHATGIIYYDGFPFVNQPSRFGGAVQQLVKIIPFPSDMETGGLDINILNSGAGGSGNRGGGFAVYGFLGTVPIYTPPEIVAGYATCNSNVNILLPVLNDGSRYEVSTIWIDGDGAGGHNASLETTNGAVSLLSSNSIVPVSMTFNPPLVLNDGLTLITPLASTATSGCTYRFREEL